MKEHIEIAQNTLETVDFSDITNEQDVAANYIANLLEDKFLLTTDVGGNDVDGGSTRADAGEWSGLFGDEVLGSTFQDGHYVYTVVAGGGTGSDVYPPVVYVVDVENATDFNNVLEPQKATKEIDHRWVIPHPSSKASQNAGPFLFVPECYISIFSIVTKWTTKKVSLLGEKFMFRDMMIMAYILLYKSVYIQTVKITGSKKRE